MKVIVGSLNPTKIEGTKFAFLQFFEDVKVRGTYVKSEVPKQPFGKETVMGAINRAINSYDGYYDFSVGIEAGLFKFDAAMTGYIDIQVAAIFDGVRTTLGFGPGFEYPPLVVNKVLSGAEVGDVMEELTGIENLGEKTGAIYYLTKGIVSRSELSSIAVTMALIPRINPELYEL